MKYFLILILLYSSLSEARTYFNFLLGTNKTDIAFEDSSIEPLAHSGIAFGLGGGFLFGRVRIGAIVESGQKSSAASYTPDVVENHGSSLTMYGAEVGLELFSGVEISAGNMSLNFTDKSNTWLPSLGNTNYDKIFQSSVPTLGISFYNSKSNGRIGLRFRTFSGTFASYKNKTDYKYYENDPAETTVDNKSTFTGMSVTLEILGLK